jgi:hypothetical protein
MRQVALIGLIAALLPGAALAEPCLFQNPDALQLMPKVGTGSIAAKPSPTQIKVGQQFTLVLTVCGEAANVTITAVHAMMPKHGHGINYQARVTSADTQGTYQAEGMLLHMPGQWRLLVDGQRSGKRVRFATEVMVTP